MNYLPFAILAQLLNSVAVTVDKFLLTRAIPDPLIYIFYFSLISLLVVFIIPFVPLPAQSVLILGSASTLSWIAAAYLMFWLLKTGQVQRVIPVIGALTPLFLLVFAFRILSITQIEAIITLIAGLLLLTLEDLKGSFRKSELIPEIISAFFFAVSYYLLSLAFARQSFLTVLVWSKPVLIPLSILFFIIPRLRKKILPFIKGLFSPRKKVKAGNWWPAAAFGFGQISAAVSELLLVFAISLANPAVVNALQGLKYVFLMIFSLILGKKYPDVFKNNFRGVHALTQTAGVLLIGAGLYLLAIA